MSTPPHAAIESPSNEPSAGRRVIVAACATNFVASLCVMIVEIVAGRLIAPHLGTSLYTWTSVIGVVLAGLAAGGYVGGRLADRFPSRGLIAALCLMAAACCYLILIVNNHIMRWPFMWFLPFDVRTALHVLLTFGPAALLMGTIPPVTAKTAVAACESAGKTIGSVYAWGSIGSILGTFLGGFLLIAWRPAWYVVHLVALVLCVLALCHRARAASTIVSCAVAAVLFVVCVSDWGQTAKIAGEIGLRDEPRDEVFFEKDSHYSHVCIVPSRERPNERVMLLDKLIHSRIDMRTPYVLGYGYEIVFANVTDYIAGDRQDINCLILGGGGYTHPRHIVRERPHSKVQVVEIDPVVTEAAMEAFGLDRDPGFDIVHLDARQHLMDLTRRKAEGESIPAYDFIFLDAVIDLSIPFHLTTVECQRLISDLLAPNGVFMIIAIDILEEGEFLAAEIRTTQQTFEHVTCFATDQEKTKTDASGRTTFVIVASHAPIDFAGLKMPMQPNGLEIKQLSDAKIADLIASRSQTLLTDDYAPVECLMAKTVLKAGRDAFIRYYNRGNERLAHGDFAGAEADYRRAVELQPDLHFAHLNLGDALVNLNRLPEAIDAFTAAAKLRPNRPEPLLNVGSTYMRMRDYERARDVFTTCIQLDPNYATGHDSLGMALANLGRFDEARQEFLKAISIEPEHVAKEHLAILDAAMHETKPATSTSNTTDPTR